MGFRPMHKINYSALALAVAMLSASHLTKADTTTDFCRASNPAIFMDTITIYSRNGVIAGMGGQRVLVHDDKWAALYLGEKQRIMLSVYCKAVLSGQNAAGIKGTPSDSFLATARDGILRVDGTETVISPKAMP